VSFVSLGDFRVWTEQRGEGKPLLYIGGTGEDLRQRVHVLHSLLPKHFRVLAYDQRGMGQSEIPDRPTSMRDYAADAVKLLDAMGWDECGVLGFSFGGMVAQELALLAPERVTALGLVATSAGGEGRMSSPLHAIQHLPLRERAQQWLYWFDSRNDDEFEEKYPERYKKRLDWMMEHLKSSEEDPRLHLGEQKLLEARRWHNTWERLPMVQTPTMLLAGEFDLVAPPNQVQAICERLPNAEMHTLKGGHLMLWEVSRGFVLLRRFFQQQLAVLPDAS
jgi:3-oxoadipate enol-lactonase